jgi:hypothetical protein
MELDAAAEHSGLNGMLSPRGLEASILRQEGSLDFFPIEQTIIDAHNHPGNETMIIANSLMANTITGIKRMIGDTTLKLGGLKQGSMKESGFVEETVEDDEEEEPDEDGEPDIRNMTESEMESYYSMKALKKVYVKQAMPLRKAKNTSLQNYKIVKLLGQGGFG